MFGRSVNTYRQIDKRKAGQLAMAIQVAFQQMGAFDASSAKVALVSSQPMPVADVEIIESVKRLQNMGRLSTSPQGSCTGSLNRAKMDELQVKSKTRPCCNLTIASFQ